MTYFGIRTGTCRKCKKEKVSVVISIRSPDDANGMGTCADCLPDAWSE